MGTARDIAGIARVSVPAIVAAALRRAASPGAARDWPADDRFLKRLVDFEGHPWLDRLDPKFPGRRAHIAAILTTYPFLDTFERARARPMIAPLMARPVLEASLACPTWLLSSGGFDRALARAAFGNRLPALILNRRGKGRFGAMLDAAFEAARPRMRTLLLDGLLVREGVVDADAIERCLSRSLRARSYDHFRVADLADVELWARSVTAFENHPGA